MYNLFFKIPNNFMKNFWNEKCISKQATTEKSAIACRLFVANVLKLYGLSECFAEAVGDFDGDCFCVG